MSGHIITNCHIHIFSRDYIPSGYPPYGAGYVSRIAWIRRPLAWFLRNLPFGGEKLRRYASFIEIAARKSQREIFQEIRTRYPLSTRFVVLPMDLRGLERGTPRRDIRRQHQELAELAEKYPDQILPFIHVDPRSATRFGGPEPLEIIEEFHAKGFRGIKLYPPLGYAADDDIVMPIYAYAEQHGLPVMSHCSRGGVEKKGLDARTHERLTAPHRYTGILQRFPDMKLCLAHFGGHHDWESFLERPWEDDSTPLHEMDWMSQIWTMIRSGDHPNLYTDISYTIFRFQRFIPILKVLMSDQNLCQRTLFGSDFYMIEKEKFPERELSMRLRAELGEKWFWRIAESNPQEYLS